MNVIRKYLKQFVIGAILGIGFISILFGVFFVFTPNGEYEKQGSKNKNDKVNPVFDWDNDSEAFYYWSIPEDSFGTQFLKTVNWSFFKQKFTQHTDWLLQYKRYSWSSWTNGNQYLSIDKSWNESGFWKINLTFTAPVDVFEARFIFSCDLPVLQYIEKDGYEVWLNYSFNATENISLMFNWSDLKSYPGLYFNKGVQNNKFYFLFGKQGIPAGSYVFDPWFGSQSYGTNNLNIENLIIYSVFSPSSSGTVDNISCYMNPVNVDGQSYCYLVYDNSDRSFVGKTEQGTLNEPASDAWYTLNASGTISVDSADNYCLCAWASSAAGAIYVKYPTDAGSGILGDSETYNYGSPPDPVDNTEIVGSRTVPIYASYTVGGGEPEWTIISSDKNGSWSNTTFWVLVAESGPGGPEIDGSWSNTTFWELVSSDKNGSWVNSTIFSLIDNTKNGSWVNTSVFYLVSSDKNGSWVNSTIFSLIDNTKNGSWVNTSIPGGCVDSSNSGHADADPKNNSVNNNLSLTFLIYIGDLDGCSPFGINYTIECNNGQSTFGNMVGNGTYPLSISGLSFDTTYRVWVNSTDDAVNWCRTWSDFKTKPGNFTIISSDKNGSWVNTTIWNLVSNNKNGSWVNSTTSFQLISNNKNGSWTNTTLHWFTISNVYPGNNTNSIPLQPTMYLTINHTTGSTMNISWYYGSQGNENILLGTSNNIGNSTQSMLNYNASSRVTGYYWRIMVNDGINYENFSYSFTTEGFGGGVTPDRSIWLLSGLLLLIPFVFIILKKRREGEQ